MFDQADLAHWMGSRQVRYVNFTWCYPSTGHRQEDTYWHVINTKLKKNLVLPIDSLKSTSVVLSKYYRTDREINSNWENLGKFRGRNDSETWIGIWGGRDHSMRKAVRAEKCKDALGNWVHCCWSVIWRRANGGKGDKSEKMHCCPVREGFKCHGKELELYFWQWKLLNIPKHNSNMKESSI